MKTTADKISEAIALTSRTVNRVDPKHLSKEYKRLLKQEYRRMSRRGTLVNAAGTPVWLANGNGKTERIRAQITSNINADNGIKWAW